MAKLVGEWAGFTLESAVVVIIAFTAVVLVVPHVESQRILANEAEAVSFLGVLHRAQETLRNRGASPRYAFLHELWSMAGVEPRDDALDELGADSDDARFAGPLLVRDGYVFALYLADARGASHLESPGGALDADFWIAYAWPLEDGRTGHLLFVADQTGAIRATEFPDLGYSGTENPPPASLAPAPDGVDYPLLAKPRGWEKSLEWGPAP